MIRVSDIMDKEIINVKNGKKMGFITDIDIDVNEGRVVSFSTTGEGSGGFFYRGVDMDVIIGSEKIGIDEMKI